MFRRNPLANALEEINRHPLIQSFLTRHNLSSDYVNGYLWYTMVGLKDEAALKEYLRILNNMVRQNKLSAATLMQLLETPRPDDRNIGEVIAETYSKTECILLLTDLLEGMPRDQFIELLPCSYKHFRNFYTKEEIFSTVDGMADADRCIEYCLRALDEQSPLGYIMYLQRGCDPCSITAGTLADFLELLGTAIQAQRAVQELVNIIDEVCEKAAASHTLSKHGVFKRAVQQLKIKNKIDAVTKPEADYDDDEDYWPSVPNLRNWPSVPSLRK